MDKFTSNEDFWLSISENIKIKNISKQKIYSQNYNIDVINKLSETQLIGIGIPQKEAKVIIEHIKAVDISKIKHNLEKQDIKYTFIFNEDYPELLKEICSPPFMIYYRGNINVLNQNIFMGVVGSRRPCDYGARVTKDIIYDLASQGVGIVSGLALGIDAIAHETTLKAGGITAAVLGCGLDQIYPRTNTSLAENIIKNGGAIISEYPIGTLPLKPHFPARNRIVSGLSKGLIVTEATQGSGSLITAQFALEQNRDVYAIPGSIYNLGSFGTNNLIKNGAKMVTTAQDVFDELGVFDIRNMPKSKISPANHEESLIIKLLKNEPIHINEIIKITKLENSVVNSTLTIMEVTGKVKHLGGQMYRLNN